jgi:hypothetical protein
MSRIRDVYVPGWLDLRGRKRTGTVRGEMSMNDKLIMEGTTYVRLKLTIGNCKHLAGSEITQHTAKDDVQSHNCNGSDLPVRQI